MDELLTKIPAWINLIAIALSSVVVAATVLVRITPSKKDDEIADKWGEKIFKVLKWLPTIGVNPQTKKIERAYESLKEKK